MDLNSEVFLTSSALQYYQESKRLPPRIFDYPDMVSVTVADAHEFDELVHAFDSPHKLALSERDDRYVAKIQLSGALTVGTLGSVKWIEVVEPSEFDAITGNTGVNYLGFYLPELSEAAKLLNIRGVAFRPRKTPTEGKSIDITYDGEGRTFRLSDRMTVEVVDRQIAAEEARLL